MITVSGLVVIPQDSQLKEFKTNKGYYLAFNIASSETRNQERIVHRYQASLWVPENEIKEWKEKITPGSVFLIKFAELEAPIKEDKEYSFVKVKLNYQQFKKLKQAAWLEEDKNV